MQDSSNHSMFIQSCTRIVRQYKTQQTQRYYLTETYDNFWCLADEFDSSFLYACEIVQGIDAINHHVDEHRLIHVIKFLYFYFYFFVCKKKGYSILFYPQ